MKPNELLPISAYTFYEGMYIDSEIYYKYGSSYVLLCRDTLLDKGMIQRLRQSEMMNQILYVHQDNMSQILEQSVRFRNELEADAAEENLPEPEPEPEAVPPPAPAVMVTPLDRLQERVQLSKDYDSLTSQTTNLLDLTAKADTVPMQYSESVASSVQKQVEETDPSLLIHCINTLRQMDAYLYCHSTNVAMLNGLIGKWLGLPKDQQELLVQTGLLHDVGKLRVPSEILNKPSRLTPEEYQEVKKHASYSHEMLLRSGETRTDLLSGVRGHHERMNGSGYPDGLPAKDISLFARITAVSDVYDAMVAKRPYKAAHSPFEILAQFATSRFSDLDIEVVNVFLANITYELTDKTVLLSDGRRGRVAYISPANFAYPLVWVGGSLVATNESLRCVAMDNFLSIVN